MTYTTVTACVCSGSQSGWPEKSSQALRGQTTESLLSMIYKLRFQRDLQSLVSVLGAALKLIRRNSKIEFKLDRLRELKDRAQAKD